MRRVPQISILSISCIFILQGCGVLFPTPSLHYKLAVDVVVNGVRHHGEGVYLVQFQSQGPLLIGNQRQWSVGVVGEAFPVVLGERGIMFVLMCPDSFRRSNPPNESIFRFGSSSAGEGALASYFGFSVRHLPNGLWSRMKIESFAESTTTEDMPPGALPLLVRYRDINDPTTIERVDPFDPRASFGPDVTVARVTASITHDEVTTGLERYLGGQQSSLGFRVGAGNPSLDKLLNLGSAAFKQGYPQ